MGRELMFWVTTALVGAALTLFVSAAFPATPEQLEMQQTARHFARVNDLPEGLLEAVCEQESRWRNVSGAHGEIGPCQVLPSTAYFHGMRDEAAKIRFSYGARGDSIRDIQLVLAEAGLYTGSIDGIWGPLTHKAVLEFQRERSLAVDGIVGPNTWTMLFPQRDPPGHSLEEQLWKPENSIRVAAEHLRWCLDRTGSPMIALGCYNGGLKHPVVRYQMQTKERYLRIQHERLIRQLM